MAAEDLTQPFARLTEDGTVVQEATPPPPPPMPEAETPAPPPVMPTPEPVAPPAEETAPPQSAAAAATTMAAPAGKADGWEVDTHQLKGFGDAVMRARSYLDTVQAKVNRMQGAELTPQLGTSPVGTQLAKKFDDRLNSVDGLRAMLVEAMKRMDDFVTSAEEAARTYEEADELDHRDESRPAAKNGG